MEQIKKTLENIFNSIEDTGILNDANLQLLHTASREYQAVVIDLKKIDGSKFGTLSDEVKPFAENTHELRTSQSNVDQYHAYRIELIRKIEDAINSL
jgi:cobalamin biosynthesis Co2+ chelatase CbiK